MRGWRHGSLSCGQTRWRVGGWTGDLYRWRCCAECLVCWGDGVRCTDLFAPVLRSVIEANRVNAWTDYQESAVVVLELSLVARRSVSCA